MQQRERLFQQGFLYGGDYNPEQWSAAMGYPDETIWEEDIRLMRAAHVNLVTVGVFSWATWQPAEGVYTFAWLDRVLALLAAAEIGVCLGTGTAAQPAWLSAAYPDALPVTELGLRRHHGERMNYCPTSPDFRRLANALVRQLAERYGQHPAVRLWHVSNEYGPACYCERCAARFREWLQARYGTLDALNRHWVTPFWSHVYTAWEQIQPPTSLGEQSMQGLSLDYSRFLSDSNLANYQEEAAILRELTPQIAVMTNFHGLTKRIDYQSWAPAQSVITWDSYPAYDEQPSNIAFQFDLMRSLKDGQSWVLMEQTPSQTQWRTYNPVKRPGQMRLQSYQAIAHGADGTLFFQWRQARGSAEMFHGAILSHHGHTDTRVFREVTDLGAELQALDPQLLGTRTPARVALIFSWPNWWAVEDQSNPHHALDYLATVRRYYQALWQRQVAVDIIAPDQPLDGYALVIAPLWMLVTEAQGQAIERYVTGGGRFLTTYFSGAIDADGRAWLGGYPGPLRRTLGLWVEEIDPLPPERHNTVIASASALVPFGISRTSEWGEVVRLAGAAALATFGQDYYAGQPALTQHRFGAGMAYYLATQLEPAALEELLAALCHEAAITAPLTAPAGVEVTVRQRDERRYYFLLNHLATPQSVALPAAMTDLLSQESYARQIVLPPQGVAILVPSGG